MSTVATKNIYELLGNDPELDPDAEPKPPTVVKTLNQNRPGKREGPDERKPRNGVSYGADNGTFAPKKRDDGIREDRHRDRASAADPTKGYGTRERASRGGPRGARGAARSSRDDRHSKTGVQDHEKQVARGWGANTGEGEFEAEREGLNDARKEEDAEGIVANDTTPVDADGNAIEPAEPEPETMSYEQYMSQQEAKREGLKAVPAARAANEGTKVNFPEGKPFSRDEENEDLVPAKEKHHRVRDRDDKSSKYSALNVDLAWVEQAAPAGRGGDRGDRGDRGERRGGRGRGEGGFRGDRGRGGRGGRGGQEGGFRGNDRGGRGGARGGRAPNVTDDAAFPALG